MSVLNNWKTSCFLYIIGCLILFSCKPTDEKKSVESYYEVTDFTEDSVFTPGIEGPAVDSDGNLYVVNYGKQGTIGKVTPDGNHSLFVTLPEGSIGNGIRMDQAGNWYIADYPMHNVLKIDAATKEISVFAHDSTMNQPNDIAITHSGILFASDPSWANGTGNLWRIDRDGTTHLLESDMGTTNGVEVSPDDRRLYVNESVQRKVWAYDLSPEGEISNKRLLIEFPDFGMDGMRCDSQGNLLITRHGKGTVAMVSPDGELIREIIFKGKKPSNIAFGGPDGKTCYVTLQDRGCVETFRTEFAGRSWSMRLPP